ncbi:MAG TPA: glycine/sarcosine/betaine reductase selenoprotein B family protein [Thermodesulfobacteriota bacterium]
MSRLARLVDRLGAMAFAASPALQRHWARRRVVRSTDVPWAPPPVALSAATVALVTTAGVHLDTDPPFDLDARDGDPTFRRIPRGVDRRRLVVSHGHYDSRDVRRDVNVVLPLDRLEELAAAGRIGGVAPVHYGFGWIRDVAPLVGRTAPVVARELVAARVGAVVLTPA